MDRGRFPPSARLTPGLQYVMRTAAGGFEAATLIALEGERVVLDFSHPLAGVPLKIAGTLHKVRRARASELKGMAPRLEPEEDEA